jgi:ankyrin repeat protein
MEKETLEDIIFNEDTFLLLNMTNYTKEELNEYFDENNNFPLLYAIINGQSRYFLFNDEILQQLDLNLADKQGRTALMWAALFGLYNEIKIMLENGADWTVMDNEGKIALDYAKEYEKIEREYEPAEDELFESKEIEAFWAKPQYDIVGIFEKPELYTKDKK